MEIDFDLCEKIISEMGPRGISGPTARTKNKRFFDIVKAAPGAATKNDFFELQRCMKFVDKEKARIIFHAHLSGVLAGIAMAHASVAEPEVLKKHLEKLIDANNSYEAILATKKRKE